MTIHFQKEMEFIKSQILGLGNLVEEQVFHAVRAVEDRDQEIAQRVIDADDKVDTREIEIEEECLKVMALHQPVAIDLRLIVSVLKINSDLERVGDLAVNIAQTVSYLSSRPADKGVPFDFASMFAKTRSQLHKSLDCLVNLDTMLANQVLEGDSEVDAMHKAFIELVESRIASDPDQVGTFLRYLSISRNLERIGDHATNIAEDVLYMVRGRIARHHHDET